VRIDASFCGLASRLSTVPAGAWLQFEVSPNATGSVIRQTAVFEPHGVTGLLYWYALYPVHGLIFGGMLRGIARAAERSVAGVALRRARVGRSD